MTTDYLSNALNQYEYLGTDDNKPSAQNLAHDADGNLVEAFIVADMNCDGALDSYDIDPFVLALTNPTLYEQTYPDCDIMNADVNGDGVVDSFDSTAFSEMLASGNTATWLAYEWNAENRLTAVIPQAPQAGDKKVELAYDYMGRRVRKHVYEWDVSEWDLTADTKFVWAGWLLLLELDALDQDAVVRKYTWGLDLAGHNGSLNSLEGAGGIGGLLAVHDVAEEDDYVYLYDANGNVGQLVAWASGFGGASGNEWHADRLVAHYEYDPYGNVVNDISGYAYADENPYRFSTKPFDDETGLGYWGRRYYSPRTGRWLSRDPIQESGGRNLYAYVGNRPANRIDALGEHVLQWLGYLARVANAIRCCMCGPDVTDWLVDQINTNISSDRIKKIKEQMRKYRAHVDDDPVAAVLYGLDAYDMFRELVKARAVWDFKVTQGFKGRWCPSEACPRTVTLCGKCFFYDVPGNIHFGAVGLVAGIPERDLKSGAAMAQAGGVDEPGDVAAIDIGFWLYYYSTGTLTTEDLCWHVGQRASELNPPNHAGNAPDCPGIPCVFEKWR